VVETVPPSRVWSEGGEGVGGGGFRRQIVVSLNRFN
jgi:hypothetical protein